MEFFDFSKVNGFHFSFSFPLEVSLLYSLLGKNTIGKIDKLAAKNLVILTLDKNPGPPRREGPAQKSMGKINKKWVETLVVSTLDF
jgi:hypothetical protein